MVESYEDKRAALDTDVLLSEAARLSGSSDVGDERFIHALRTMTRFTARRWDLVPVPGPDGGSRPDR